MPHSSRQRRYNSAAVASARKLHAAGFTISEIREQIAQGSGRKPAKETVRAWVDHEYAERRSDGTRLAKRRYRRRVLAAKKAKPGPKPVPVVLSDELLLELRLEDKLTFTAISAVSKRFLGVELSQYQVAARLERLGAPKNENKARATREQNARRRLVAA